jgi:hypothetical protein
MDVDCWDVATAITAYAILQGDYRDPDTIFEENLTACCNANPNCYNLPPSEIGN